MKVHPDYKSRFRILKGGKISLVVSALLVGTTLCAVPLPTAYTIDDVNSTTDSINLVNTGSLTITENGDQNVSGVATQGAVTIADGANVTINIENGGILRIDDGSANYNRLLYALGDISGDINNSGLMSVVDTNDVSGIYVEGDNNATIINSSTGVINVNSTDDDAIAVYIGGNNNASISNEGNITSTGSTAIGIYLDNNYGAISNSGTITVSAPSNVYGIYVNHMYNSSSLLNSNTISATSTNGDAAGIYVYDMNGTSTIANSGTIIATSANGDVAGIYTVHMTDDATITNEETILATSTNSSAIGIGKDFNVMPMSMHGDSQIINETDGNITVSASTMGGGISMDALHDNAQIINRGIIDVEASYNSFGIATSWMDGNATITNSGTLTATSTDGYGSYATAILALRMEDNATITNSGTLIATSLGEYYGSAIGIYVSDLYDTSSITNSGTITVDSNIDFAAGIYIEDADSSASITNSGTITATLDGVADRYAWSVSSSGAGTLNNTYVDAEHPGILSGNIKYMGTVNNSGTISLPYNANFDTTPGIIMNFVNSGTLEIGLLTDGTLEGTTHSQLDTLYATFEDGSTINVNVLEASENEDGLMDEILEDVVAAGADLTLEGTLNITDNSALINFELYNADAIEANTDQTIDLLVVKGSILDSTVEGGGETPAQSVAGLLDEAQENDEEQMEGFLNDLYALETDEQVAQAVANASPDSSGGVSGAATQIVNSVQGIVEQRQDVGFGGNLNSGDIAFSDKSVWVKPFGSYGSQNDKNSMNGFDVSAYGLGMGIDAEYAPGEKLGFALFLTKANVDINNVSQEADLDAYTILAYGSKPVLDARTKFLYQVGYSWIATDTEKTILGNSATADYTAKSAFVDLKVVRDYQINPTWRVQPIVEMTYRRFETPSYTESYTNMHYAKSSATEILAGIGVRSHYKLDEDSKFIANANVAYDLKDDKQGVSVSFPSTSSTFIESIDNGRWSYKLGIGYETNIDKTSNINFSLDHEGQGSDFTNNTISLKYVYKF